MTFRIGIALLLAFLLIADSHAQLTQMFFGEGGVGPGGGGTTCAGVIDLSVGCTLSSGGIP